MPFVPDAVDHTAACTQNLRPNRRQSPVGVGVEGSRGEAVNVGGIHFVARLVQVDPMACDRATGVDLI